MKTFTNLAHRAFKKCASLGTTNRNRYYLFAIIMLLTLGVGNAWGEETVVYQLNTAQTAIATSNSYANYGPVSCKSADNSTSIDAATWKITFGSKQTNSPAGLWLGSNSTKKANMKLATGNFSEASAIATAIGKQTSDTYLTAIIGETELTNVSKVRLSYSTPGGTAPSNAWILYSTDNGTTWSIADTKTKNELSASGTDFEFTSAISSARYAFVIYSTGYCQFKVPTLTFISTSASTPKTQYTISWSVNGATKTLSPTNVYEGDALGTLPTPDQSDICTDKVFVGWATEANKDYKHATDAPELITKDTKPSGNTTYYAVFATEGEGAAEPEEVTWSYSFSSFSGTSVQYAEETHDLGGGVIIKIKGCHINATNDDFRIYGSQSGYVISNKLPGTIKSMSFNVGYKSDNLLVYGSTDGSTWTEVGSIATTTTYADKSIDFGETNYTYFKLDVDGTQQIRIKKMSVTYMSAGGVTTTYSDYTTSCDATSDVIVKTLKSIAVSGMTLEYVEGAEFAFDGTCTATYSVTKNDVPQDDETKTVTPTVFAPNMTQIGEQTVNVSYTDGGVTAETSYTINITEKPKYTITWNNAGTTNTTEVVQGEAFVTLPEPADCDNGKQFMGWTTATSVKNDGSDITYIKPTDKPTANTTYYAVFAVVEGGDATPTTATVSIASCGWTDKAKYTTLSIDENITASVSDGTNTGTFYSNGNNWRLYQTESATLTISATAGYEIQTVKVTYTNLNDGVLTLDGSNVTSAKECEINNSSVTFSVGNTASATNGQVRISAIEVVYAPAAKTSDYSLDCNINTNPEWTIETDEISFADKYVGFEYTEEFTINASNLNGDITLAVTGNYFDVTPKTIASNVSFPQTVTVTYKPEEAGNHTATLKITSTEVEDKTISLKGSAKEAKIYTKTDLANITKYDEVLIVGTNATGSFAMANNGATSSGPIAISVIVDDNTIATDITNIQWSVGNTDGKLIFAPKDAETWLYCNNSNNGLRIGSDAESMTFEIKDDYIFNTVQSRYIGIYNSEEWRSYTLTNGGEFPTNIKDQTFAFYIIKGEVPDNVFSITYNTNGGNAISPATDLTTIPSTLPTPTKEGYNFAGWYTDNAFTAPAIAGTPLTDNITLYAKWADPYTVAYAKTLIAADLENTGVYAYVAGVVTAVEEISTEYGNATYSIGDTEDATEILKVFRGNYLANEKFTAADQLKKGDQVVVYGKMINHTTGGHQFAQGNYIYKLTSATGKETTTLSWSATTCKVQIGATNTFPTLTKSHDITIKYTSSNTSVATIANDGTITLVAAGTTTITAAIEEDATYAASSASYELTVVEVVPTGIFQLYSGELAEGEYVLVDGTNDKALKATVAGDTRLAGEDVTIADNAILNPDASIVWNLAKSGTDWTIYNEYEGKYVAGTGVKNAAQLLTDGTDEKALWTISGTETYDIVNKVNEEGGVNSHLRWGGSYWACYGSTTGKALRLYKKIDVPTPTISLASGTYIGTQTATVSCALATATIYYTINGDTPTTSSASIAAGGTVSITESCTLKVIAVANTKESSVVETTYKIIPDGGIWVLVDDVNELKASDLLVLASKEHSAVAGPIADGKEFMASVSGAEFSTNKMFITTLPAEAMILTLGGSAGAWTFEYQELYLNASGANNSLGETATTTWTIEIENHNATIATNDYKIRYNVSSPRFKVYNSTNGTVLPQIYKYTTDFYTRDVTNGNYGTICLPYASSKFAGAEFYEVSWLKTDAGLYLDELVEGASLEAGKPYIFKATDSKITVAYEGEKKDTPVDGAKGLTGTFDDMAPGSVEGHYIIAKNQVWVANDKNYVSANRAYINSTVVPTTEQAKIPGRRRVCMGENETTGFDQIIVPTDQVLKVIENGQLIIIRNGEKYNVQGQRL